MATYEDVDAIAGELSGVSIGTTFGNEAWQVGKSTFAWVRPFSKADIKRFGTQPVPSGPILGVMVADLDDKEAILAEGRPGVFTIPHFDGYKALLVQLDVVEADTLRELVVDAWLTVASSAARQAFLAAEQ